MLILRTRKSEAARRPLARAAAAQPLTPVGLVTFTPATGTFHEDLIIRDAGTILHPIFDGTYTVDANGHGTMMWTGMNSPKHRDFYIVNGGAELKWIITDPRYPCYSKQQQHHAQTIARLAHVGCRAEQAAIFRNQPARFNGRGGFLFTSNAYGSLNPPVCSCVSISIAIYHSLPRMSFSVGRNQKDTVYP